MAQVRQWQKKLDDIRADHRYRYEWAASYLRQYETEHVLDAACGCGYGSWIMANDGYIVTATDISRRAIRFAEKYWDHDSIEYVRGNLNTGVIDLSNPTRGLFADTVVSFETIEHLIDPTPFLRWCQMFSYGALISVPNERDIPFSKEAFPFHERHYTREQAFALVAENGGVVRAWFGQKGKESPVEPEVEGRTLILDVRWSQ